MSEIIAEIFNDSYRGALVCFLLVLSWKVYKMRIGSDIESNCCPGFHWKLSTSNDGGQADISSVV